jgi:hypothetical protein
VAKSEIIEELSLLSDFKVKEMALRCQQNQKWQTPNTARSIESLSHGVPTWIVLSFWDEYIVFYT